MIDKKTEAKKFAKDLERVMEFAELKALSNYSLEHPLNDRQFKRFKELGNKYIIPLVEKGDKT